MDSQSAPYESQYIELDRFLKFCQIVGSGGEAKMLIRSGTVMVNGAVETRRGRKLRHGDEIEIDGQVIIVEIDAAAE